MIAYWHSNPQDDLKHSGLGMYISRVYCEKHGGRLAVQICYLCLLSYAGYFFYYWQRPMVPVDKTAAGLYGSYLIAITATVIFWSFLSVTISNLFRSQWAGIGISFLLGENGAGKTTLMRVLTTILKPADGTVLSDNTFYCESNYDRLRKKIGYLPQELNLYPNLTIRECLEYLGELSGIPKKTCRKRIDKYLEKTSFAEHQKKKMKQLSGGMKRRVGLIQALLNDPEFLVVDEPTTGLDPEERIRIRNLLVDFSKNRTVLFSTHVVEDLAAACGNLAVMSKGEFLYSGSMSGLLHMAKGHIWIGTVKDEEEALAWGRSCHITSKQYTENGLRVKIISDQKPNPGCSQPEITLEDAYMYLMNQKNGSEA